MNEGKEEGGEGCSNAGREGGRKEEIKERGEGGLQGQWEAEK